MTRKVGVLIAVEQYADAQIPPVKYAEADAKGLSAALHAHGFIASDQVVLINAAATKTRIESKVRKTTQALRKGDTLHMYYAGHGFAKNAENYITCYDTDLDDLEDTSIKVAWLFKQFQDSDCRRIALFLDSCESGMLANSRIRGIYSDLKPDELKRFFEKAEHCVCFAACKPGQKSYASDNLRHGIWTHHLIEALIGKAPLALESKSLVTSSSLQNHLSQEVPRTLRATYAGVQVQTPSSYGASSGDFLVGDVSEILAKRKAAINPTATQLRRVQIYSEQELSVRSLSGFRKHHRVPDRVTNATENFIATIATDDVSRDLEEVYESLKDAFRLKRKDLRSAQADSAGSIITPYFDYEVNVSLNPDDPSTVCWRRSVLNIRDPQQILTDDFDEVFDGVFDTLEIENARLLDIGSVVDQIEDMEDDRIEVRYDKDLEWCSIHLEGTDSVIRIEPGTFSIQQPHAGAPRLLIKAFFAIQKQLVNTHELKQLALPAATSPKTK
jgi:hypothetical protein